MEHLDGKVAVITGGASGIGAAMARRFGRAGMRIALADIEPDALDRTVQDLHDAGVDAVGFVCDVAETDQMDRLRDQVLDAFGGVHLVCNNAGVGSGGSMATLTVKDWQWCLGVNLWGVIHGIRVFLPVLLEQGDGHIVNTASVAGLFAAPFMGPYNASKFAVVGLSETLYNELAMTGGTVGCSVLCPAWVATRIHESERNRPESLRDEAEDGPLAGDGLREILRGVIESGMDPDRVADAVHDAVVAGDFYILTHDDSAAAVEARTAAILAGGTPPFFMPQ